MRGKLPPQLFAIYSQSVKLEGVRVHRILRRVLEGNQVSLYNPTCWSEISRHLVFYQVGSRPRLPVVATCSEDSEARLR